MSVAQRFKDIADAIREKTGGTDVITPLQMPGAIRGIQTGLETMTEAAWEALSIAEKRALGVIGIIQANSGYERGIIVNGADYIPEGSEITPSSTSGPSGTKGTWTGTGAFDGYYTTENIANAYFLLSYDNSFTITDIIIESSPINNSAFVMILEYYDISTNEWVEVYNSGSAVTPSNINISITSLASTNAVRWRTTTTKVAPYNLRIPVFYAKGF